MSGFLPATVLEDTNDDLCLRALAGAPGATPATLGAAATGVRVVTVANSAARSGVVPGVRPPAGRAAPERGSAEEPARAAAVVARAGARERPVVRRLVVLGPCL